MLKYYYAEIGLLENTEFFEKKIEEVNTQRKEKIRRCKHKEDKQRLLMAGLLLRMGLEKEGIFYETAEFSKTAEGKPFFVTDIPISFSISHAGQYAGCVFSDKSVGLDIENMEKSLFLPEREHLFFVAAKKIMSEAEWKHFEDTERKKELFLEYWTKKEAYSKYIGKGLGMDFTKVDTERMKHQFWTYWTKDGYCMSIYAPEENYEEMVVEKCMMN